MKHEKEKRTVKDALRRSEEKWHSLFNNMSDGFAYHRILLDAEGKPCDYVFHEVNEAFERLTGLKREHIIGRRVTKVLPGIENDPAGWIGKYGHVALTGSPVQFETYSEPLDKWYSVSAFSPHKGYFAVTFSDITEQKRMEQALRESEEKLRCTKEEWELTFDAVPDLVAILDNEHRIVRVNRAMADRLGVTPDQCRGLRCYEAVHGMSVIPGFCPHSLTCRDGRQHVAEVHERRLGGHFLVSTTPLCDQQGRVTGAVHVARDITARKQAEQELRKAYDDLELRVRERTSKLRVSNKALVEYAARLERLNTELQDFSFVAAHDLQEPLRKIQTFCDMAIKRCAPTLDSAGRQYLDRVVSSASRMRQLLRDLLGFSRTAARPGPFKEIDLARTAREAADLFEEDLDGSGGRVEIEGMAEMKADEDQMRCLFQNLIDNALKFRSEENPRIKIHARQDRGRVEIIVKDNGIGFDPQYAERIFKPFQKLHSRREYEGTGMGLAVCRKIVEWHGGSIKAESESGEGSTFLIRLPANHGRKEGMS